MIHYVKAFFLIVMVGNAIALPFYVLLNFMFGKVPEDKQVSLAAIAGFFMALIAVAIWVFRKKLPDGSVPYGKMAYRAVGIALFGTFVIMGVSHWIADHTVVSFNVAKDFLLGTGMLLGAIVLEHSSPWLRLQ